MKWKIPDTNALVIMIVAMVEPGLVKSHKRTASYFLEQDDAEKLIKRVELDKLLLLPNILTEVDNLLCGTFHDKYQPKYLSILEILTQKAKEEYIPSKQAVKAGWVFSKLGITDTLIINLALHYRKGKLLDYVITGDSKLSDYLRGYNIPTYDIKAELNKKL
ncbi:PIN domain-containing protein [Rhodoflexus caldus]|uniref:hypothetical protein n=1 Tax=Rhodoflexus caldus TaxID=2891236 RepID=UPI00202A3D01|nr:hypothetical protein [Rhodoflexus caldus]